MTFFSDLIVVAAMSGVEEVAPPQGHQEDANDNLDTISDIDKKDEENVETIASDTNQAPQKNDTPESNVNSESDEALQSNDDSQSKVAHQDGPSSHHTYSILQHPTEHISMVFQANKSKEGSKSDEASESNEDPEHKEDPENKEGSEGPEDNATSLTSSTTGSSCGETWTLVDKEDAQPEKENDQDDGVCVLLKLYNFFA